eukprot:Pompholyxophrys_punicea_v1_NODE_80_length_3711_cov_3.592724.p5 type:complete len:103 gc:universal NODE_80_length_3711_cov_3.592724:2167-1859(-)
MHDVLDPRERIDTADDELVQLAEVRHPANGVVLLWNNEGGKRVEQSSTAFKDPNVAKMLEFALEKFVVDLSDGIRSAMDRARIGTEVQMNFPVRVDAELAGE